MRSVISGILVVYAALTFLVVLAVALGQPLPLFVTPTVTMVGFAYALLHAAYRQGARNAFLLLFLSFLSPLPLKVLGLPRGLFMVHITTRKNWGQNF